MKRSVAYFLLSSAMIFSMTNIPPMKVVGAESSDFSGNSEYLNIKSITPSSGEIDLEWEGNSSEFRVYYGKEMVYSGSGKEYKHKNLESNTNYSYLIVAMENDEVKDIAKVETTTLPDKKTIKTMKENSKNGELKGASINPLAENSINTIIQDNKIKLDWSDIKGIKDYKVLKNGKLIDNIKDSHFTDSNVKSETVYEIIGKKEVSKERKEEIKKHLSKMGKKNISKKEEEELFYDNVSIIKIVDEYDKIIDIPKQEKNLSKTIEAAVSPDVKTYKLKYYTFIADEYVVNPFASYLEDIDADDWPNWVFQTKYFNGNNRSWSTSTAKNKTDAIITASWGNYNQSVDLNKGVGRSIFYDKNKNILHSEIASDSDMGVSVVKKDASRIVLNHDVECGIPYLDPLTPDINYEYNADLSTTGSYTITGQHDKAPNHEFYISVNGGGYQTLFQHKIVDFYHLAPTYPRWSFKITK